MKTIILSILCTIGISAYSQTPVDVYVVNPNNCPYYLTDTYQYPGGGGNMYLVSIDTSFGQFIHHYEIQDTVVPFTLTVCLNVGVTQPPWTPIPPVCVTQLVSGPTSITLVANCNLVGIEENTSNEPVKKLVKIQNLIGQTVEQTGGQILIYTYDDGTTEKIYIIK